jgi:HSP20 family protein
MLLRFDPFAELDRLARQPIPGGGRSVMPVDAYRIGDRFYLHFDLPGVDPETVDITVEKNTLTVQAERSWQPAEDADIVMSERPQGTFSRQFFLGEGLDTDQIDAGYDHGVLTVTIPVAEQAKPRKISVGAADKALAG